MMTRDILRYWPRKDDVTACVKTDAEASSEAVSLAVHQAMRFERRIVGAEVGANILECDEHELLRAFLASDQREGRVILPIVGSSGVGKSHVVRWLDAQLHHAPEAERRVVIRIPKGISLKGVLGILLETLPGAAYDQYRRALARAQQELDAEEAAGLLCEMLAHTLEEMASEANHKLRINPSDRDAQELAAYCRADVLPALLRNQLLRDQHFVRRRDGGPGVAKRLVEQLTEGRAAGSHDDRQHQFWPYDLIFEEAIDRQALGRPEQRAFAILEREERRVAAARILTIALDGAKQRLLRIDPTVGDLFDAIRRELLNEGKELVLLVEDFAVLSGLQKQLLQVAIKEGFRDGRQVLCTMRTALAYTTGYPIPETVLTRAGVEYRIPDEPGSEDEILAWVERLVGAYLNAARLGQRALETAYEAKSGALGDRRWIPRYRADVEPEARATLEAFGSSDDHYELFPFNRGAIQGLAREGCIHEGRIVYNPRYVIQNVIYKVLDHRELFEQGQFPPPTFGVRQIPGQIANAVGQRVAPAELNRYLRFLAYWGGSPSDLDDLAHVDPRVFGAFGLDRTRLVGQVPAPPPSPTPSITAIPPTTPVLPKPVSPLEAKFVAVLDQWRHDVRIGQADANQLRKWVGEALKGAIDWDWDLFKPRKEGGLDSSFFSSWVYIPKAAGNEGRGANEAAVAVCEDSALTEEVKSARVHSALMALVRFHGVQKDTWDYPGADDDLPRYAAFIDALATRARAFVRSHYFRAEWDPVPALVQTLLIGARSLGLQGADKDADHASLLSAMFMPAAAQQSDHTSSENIEEDETGWAQFVLNLAKCRGSEERETTSFSAHLLNLVGARQGQADTVHALDLLRLKLPLEDTLRTWEFTETIPDPRGVAEFAPIRSAYLELKKQAAAVGKAQRGLIAWRGRMVEWLGDKIDKERTVQVLKEAIETAKANSLTGEIDTKHLLELLESFRTARVIAAFEDAARSEDGTRRGTVLTVLGRGHESTVRLCDQLRSRFDEFLQSVDAELRREIQTYGEDPLADAIGVLRAELTELEHLLKGIPT